MSRKRPKDLVREYRRYLRDEPLSQSARGELDLFQHWLYSFAYWIEGQDLDKMSCRYHIAAPDEVACPFDAHPCVDRQEHM